LVVFPFDINFEPISSSIAFVKINSAFYQLCFLYGYQAVFFVMLLITAILACKKIVAPPGIAADSQGSPAEPQPELPLGAPLVIAENATTTQPRSCGGKNQDGLVAALLATTPTG